MVKVYFESENRGYAEIVATFADETTYQNCCEALEKEAAEHGMIVTESVDDDEPDKTYYLFGESAVSCFEGYEDGDGNVLIGVDAVLQAHEENEISSFEVFVFEEGVTKSADFISAYSGWGNYLIITEEDFNKLNS